MALSVVYFRTTHLLGRPHYVWDDYLYSVREKVEVRVTVNVTVCVVLLCCVGWWWKEGRRWNPMPAHSLLFSKSAMGAAWLNVPIRRTNRYQQCYMPSQHTYCRRVVRVIIHLRKFYRPTCFPRNWKCVCFNASPLHYYVLWVPRKVDRWH